MKKRLLSLFSIVIALILLVACFGGGSKSFTVTFNLNEGTSTAIEAQTIKNGGLVDKPADPTREGYNFNYWVYENEEWNFETNKVEENMTLVANWQIKEYQVSFNAGGGTPAPDAQTVAHGSKATEPVVDPELENNEFVGWFVGNDEYDFDTIVTDNLTITAKWNLLYVVTFNPNNDTLVFTRTASANTPVLKPLNPGKQGHVFAGWYYLDENEEAQLWDFSTPVTEDMELFADWNTAEEHVNLDFDAIELTIVDDMIELPNRGPINNIRLTWQTDNPAVVTSKGIVIPPLKGKGDATATLTATTTFAGITYSRDYTINVPAKGDPVVTSELDVSFTNLTNEFTVADANITAYFVDDGNLPYLDIQSFMLLLNGLFYSDELTFTPNGDLLVISYEVTDEESNETYYYSATVDFHEKTVYTEKMSFFNNYIQSTATDYSAGINYVDYYIEPGSSVTFYLNDYNVEMIVHEVGEQVYYLMPYNFLSTLFTLETYYSFYYNGDGFYGFYSIPKASDPDDEYATFETIKTSSYNNTQVPKDVALSAFNQTAFIFDYFFGLRNKPRYAVQNSFYEKITPNINSFLGTTENFNVAVRSFILKTLDELHSSYHFPGYYNMTYFNYPLSLSDLGPKVTSWYEDGVWEVQASISSYHNDDREGYKFLDTAKETAVIYLDGFSTASVDEEKTAETDSDVFMSETLAAIFAENPNVKNIGIDLSYNTGGNIGALLRVLGYITEKPIEMSYQDPLTGQKQTYFVTLDQEAYETVNWFFITSPVTFSAANLMTAIVKNQKLGPIFGTTSGGGAASINPFILAEGTLISISSNNLISIRTKNPDNSYTYTDVEDGIEPDLILSPRNTQNPVKILELIEEYFGG